MSQRKYFLDTEEQRPRFPWYGNKYLGNRLERADTGPIRRQMARDRKEEERQQRKTKSRERRKFKVVAGQLITGNKVLTFTIL